MTRWKEARDWCIAEFAKRQDPNQHASFLANQLLEEAMELFDLPGFGTEGQASKDGRTGRSYINVGDCYAITLYVVTGYHTAKFSIGLQCV